MKGQKLQKRKVLLFWILLFLFPVSVNAAEQEEAFLEDLELQQMQEAVNELLGEETFSLEKALGNWRGEKRVYQKGRLRSF